MQNMEPPEKLSIKIDTNRLCNRFIKYLFEEKFWSFYDDFIKREVEKNNYIINVNKPIRYSSIEKLANKSIEKGHIYIRNFLTNFLKQWKQNKDSFGNYSKFLRKLKRQDIIEPVGEYFWKCDTCNLMGIFGYEEKNKMCPKCENEPIILSQNKFPKIVKKCLTTNQFLEMFVRDSLEKSGYNLLYYQTEEDEKVKTSLRLPGNPEPIEMDSVATDENNLILCECKNIGKLTPNNIDKKKSKIDSFKKVVEDDLGKLPPINFVFVVTGKIDKNAKKYTDNKDDNIRIHLYDEEDLTELPDHLSDIKQG